MLGGLQRLSLIAHSSVEGMGGIIYRTLTRRALLLASIWLELASAGCKTAPVHGGKIRLVDDAGDTVRLAAPARRVVSLIPASTELLFAIGASSTGRGPDHLLRLPPRRQGRSRSGGRHPAQPRGLCSDNALNSRGHSQLQSKRCRCRPTARTRYSALRINTDAFGDVRQGGPNSRAPLPGTSGERTPSLPYSTPLWPRPPARRALAARRSYSWSGSSRP